jgi:hypothetical protein
MRNRRASIASHLLSVYLTHELDLLVEGGRSMFHWRFTMNVLSPEHLDTNER